MHEHSIQCCPLILVSSLHWHTFPVASVVQIHSPNQLSSWQYKQLVLASENWVGDTTDLLQTAPIVFYHNSVARNDGKAKGLKWHSLLRDTPSQRQPKQRCFRNPARGHTPISGMLTLKNSPSSEALLPQGHILRDIFLWWGTLFLETPFSKIPNV